MAQSSGGPIRTLRSTPNLQAVISVWSESFFKFPLTSLILLSAVFAQRLRLHLFVCGQTAEESSSATDGDSHALAAKSGKKVRRGEGRKCN